MDSKKKILILYASAGHGHEKAARAILDALRRNWPGVEVEAADTVKLAPGFFGELYKQTYLIQIKHFPVLWGFFYYLFDIPWVYRAVRLARRMFNQATCGRLVDLILEKKPDIIFSTHFYSTEVVSNLKKKSLYHGRLITLVTDYLSHFVWTADGVDQYCVALPETVEDLAQKGVDRTRILVTGIPAGEKFSQSLERQETGRKLGLNPDLFTVLLTSGGVGVASIESIARRLSDSTGHRQILVVCGTNRGLFDRLAKASKNNPSLKVFGFVDNMDELMEVSDVVVGKAGGLTVTEGYLKAKPMILYRSIPGQEGRNAALAARRGAAFVTNDPGLVVKKVLELADNRVLLSKMAESSGRMARPKAAEDIAAFLAEIRR